LENFLNKLTQDPIFVVGFPRSGTTLIQSLIATQADVYTLPETHFFNVINKVIEKKNNGTINPCCINSVFLKILEKMDLEFSVSEREKIFSLSESGNLTAKDLFEFIINHYIEHDFNTAVPYRWMEKTPNHAYFLNDIFSLYPDCQIINIIRHPVPAILSRKNSFKLNRDKPLSWLSSLWKRSVDSIEKFNNKHPGISLTIKYEHLTSELNRTLMKVLQFLNLECRLDKAKNFHLHSSDIVLKEEIWKKNNSMNYISNKNIKYKKNINKKAAKEIEMLLKEEMMKYQYTQFFG
jgi:hypothetical protein